MRFLNICFVSTFFASDEVKQPTYEIKFIISIKSASIPNSHCNQKLHISFHFILKFSWNAKLKKKYRFSFFPSLNEIKLKDGKQCILCYTQKLCHKGFQIASIVIMQVIVISHRKWFKNQHFYSNYFVISF